MRKFGLPAYVRQDGRIVHSNGRAECLLYDASRIAAQRGFLKGCGKYAAPLRDLIAKACAPTDAESGSILLDGPGHPAIALTSVPIRLVGYPALALLWLRELHNPQLELTGQLRSLFGLTSAEAAVAQGIAEGKTPSDIAEERQVSLGTIRSQIKAIKEKLDCRRQSEITRLLATIPGSATGELQK